MSFEKITVTEGFLIRDFVEKIEASSEKKLIFIFKESTSLLSEIKFLKKIKSAASKADKELLFVIPNKFLRNTVKGQGIPVATKVPKQYIVEEKVIQEQETKKEIEEKNPEIKKTNTFTKSKVHPTITPSNIWRAKLFFILLGIAALALFLWFWNKPRVTIYIKPELSAVPIIQNILVALPESEIPEKDEQLPKVKAIYVQSVVEGEEVVPTSGREYEVTNATGKLTLYNETDKPKFLVASRLEAPGRIIVRFKDEVTIPPKVGTEPGTAVVEVEADSFDENENPVGLRGNLDAGTELYFPALRDELKEVFYGKMNKGPLVGGSTLTRYKVVPEDEQLSEEQLLESFRDRGIQELTGEVERRSAREGGNQKLLELPQLLTSELQEFSFPIETIGKETQTVTVTGRVKVAGIVFDQAAVKDIMQAQMRKSLDDRQKIVILDETSLEYKVLDIEELEENKILKLSVRIIGIEQLDINANNAQAARWRDDLKQKIRGKSFQEAQSILANIPDIEQVFRIQTSPFWNKSIPDRLSAISFQSQTK